MPRDIRGDKLNFLNVGMGKDISIRDLAFKIAKACNFKGRIIWDDSNLTEHKENFSIFRG